MPCALPPPPCATAALHAATPECLEAWGLPELDTSEAPARTHPPLPELTERDSYGTLYSASSEHLVLRWDSGVDAEQAQSVLADGEIALEVLVEQLGMVGPKGADTHKLNLYLGDSGANAPPAYGEAYAWTDAEGYPMVVLSPEVLADWALGRVVLAHELFHVLQDNSPHPYAYEPGAPGAWLYEASAVWSEAQVWPDEPLTARWIFGWSLQPQHPLDAFAYPSSGDIAEYRQYGAFAFLRYLSGEHGDALVVDLWTQASDPDPRVALSDWLDLDAELADFAAAAVTWDLEQGADLEAAHLAAAERWPQWDERIAAQHRGHSEGWQSLSVDELGVLYVRMYPSSDEEDVRVEVSDFNGEVRVVIPGSGAHRLAPGADQTFEGSASADEVWLVLTGSHDGGVQAVEYRLRSVSAGPIQERVQEGCGCSGEGSAALIWLPLLTLGLLRRRREWSA